MSSVEAVTGPPLAGECRLVKGCPAPDASVGHGLRFPIYEYCSPFFRFYDGILPHDTAGKPRRFFRIALWGILSGMWVMVASKTGVDRF